MSDPLTVDKSAYGPILPTTVVKADIILAAAAKAGHKVQRVYGYNTTPDHNNKRCIDFMHYGDTKTRDWLLNYIKANALRLGAEGMISNRRVMDLSPDAAYRGPILTWRAYTGPNPHTDHVHVQFDALPVKVAPKPVIVFPNFYAAGQALAKAKAAHKAGSPEYLAAEAGLKAIASFNR